MNSPILLNNKSCLSKISDGFQQEINIKLSQIYMKKMLFNTTLKKKHSSTNILEQHIAQWVLHMMEKQLVIISHNYKESLMKI